MKASVVFCVLLMCAPIANGQLIWSDDFSDGNLNESPEWRGNTDHFVFSDVDGNTMLQLNAPDAGTSYLSAPVSSLFGTWSWFVRMDFSLSGSNRITFFLQSDAENPADADNAVLLTAGESGSDDVFELIHRQNGTESVLSSGSLNVNSGGGYQIEVSHTVEDGWQVFISPGYGSSPQLDLSSESVVLDSVKFFSLRPEYTSTRTDLFYFDDISFSKEKTRVIDFKTEEDRYIILTYSDHLNENTLSASDFTLNGTSSDAVTLTNSYTARIDFGELPSGTTTFSADVFADKYGFDTETYSTTITNTDTFQQGDVIINEFMYAPESGNPEFVEILNVSEKLLDLNGWMLQDNTSSAYSVSDSELLLDAGEFLVLTSDSSALANLYGSVNVHQMSSFPALNNSSPDAVRLKTASGSLVDSVAYDQSWGGDAVSLERRLTSAPSRYQANWAESESPDGATPGKVNSVGPDAVPPALDLASIVSDTEILLLFDDVLDHESAELSSNYSITQTSLDEVNFFPPDSVLLSVVSPFENAQRYEIRVDGVSDIFGNQAQSQQTELTYYTVSKPDSGSLLISEFMFDTPDDVTEYIEFYNPGPGAIDLADIELADNRLSFRQLFDQSRVVAPDSYIVVTPDNTLSEEYPEREVYSVGASFPSLNNSGDVIVIRNISDEVTIDSLEYKNSWGGDEVALERRSYQVTAQVAANWGDAPVGFGSPGVANNIPDDTDPPYIESLVVQSADSIFIQFNEAIKSDLSLAEISFEPQRVIEQLTFENERELFIHLDEPLTENLSYRFRLAGIFDLFENEISPVDTTIQYVVTSQAQPGDLLITEFMYDPAFGYSEFVEIYNVSENYLNLEEISWNDSGGDPAQISASSEILPPGSFAVLAPDETLENLFSGIDLINMGSRFSALNNGDDIIILYNDEGITLDSLLYTSDWGGDGVSLERKDFSVAAHYSSNWGDSPSAEGSTAGKENVIEPDVESPAIIELTAFRDRILIRVSEELDTIATNNNISISVSDNNEISEADIRENEVELFFSDAFEEGSSNILTIAGLTDIFGNVSEEQERAFLFVEPFSPSGGSLLITEFVYLEDAGAVPEFVEIFNNSDRFIDLGDVAVGDDRSSYRIELSEAETSEKLIVPPGEVRAVTYDVRYATENLSVIAIENLPSFNNFGGDAVMLLNAESGVAIDSLFYDETWPAIRQGESYSRISLTSATADPSKWVAANPSAGRENEVLEEDEQPPELQFAGVVSADTLELIFDEYIDAQNASISGNGMNVPIIDVTGDNILADASNLNPVEPNFIRVESVYDVAGNEMVAIQDYPVAVQLSGVEEKPVINELLFDPINEPGFEQSEFIELYNPSLFELILPDNLLSVYSTTSERTTVLEADPTRYPKTVASNSFVTFFADTALKFLETRFAKAFTIDESDFNKKHFQIDRTTLILANSGSVVLFRDENGALVDSLSYDESWANPNIPDTKGKSLERIRIESETTLSGNWTSSAAESGATPGIQNSVTMSEPKETTDRQILISVNPFSPDDDGFEDHTSIDYQFEHSSYLLTIRIFDQYGRTVRLLTDQRPAGATGSVIWDGNNDDGERCRFGRYILLITAHDATAGKKKTFKKTVVIATK